MLLNKRISILYFINIILPDLIAIVLYAILVGIADIYSFFKSFSVPLAVTLSLGTSLSLLLAFRTGQSYDRWWEARQIWGSIVNDSRTLIRQLQAFSNNDQVVKEAIERQIIWCFAMGEYLRKLPFSERVNNYLAYHDINPDQAANLLLSEHSKAIKTAGVNAYQQVQLDSTIMRLCDAMGKCERIKNTVFPRSYSMLIHFIIYVFATLLPFGIPDESPLMEIGLTIVIPVIFIAIEKTSILMQDPFENRPVDTSVTAIAQGIEKSLKGMIGETVSLPPASDTYYVL